MGFLEDFLKPALYEIGSLLVTVLFVAVVLGIGLFLMSYFNP